RSAGEECHLLRLCIAIQRRFRRQARSDAERLNMPSEPRQRSRESRTAMVGATRTDRRAVITSFIQSVRLDLGEDLRALVHGAPPRKSAHVRRPLVCIALAACAFALYLALAIRLDAGAYFTVDNLAFDFDPLRNITELFKAGAPTDFRHPLLWALR